MDRRLFIVLPLLVLAGAQCARPRPAPGTVEAQREMLALLLPDRIEIMAPFTRVASFDGDRTPDGIDLMLRAVNSFGNPGLMIVGDIQVEMYEYVPASADRKGTRLDAWQLKLHTLEDQRNHWNQLTQMYELRLRVNPAILPKAGRCVVAVTYTTPLGEHLTDEVVLTNPFRPLADGGPAKVGVVP